MDYKIYLGDCIEGLRKIDDCSVDTCVTSPPYLGLRDYGVDGQIGLETTPEEFVNALTAVFREVRRVLRDDGTLWLNLGDSYSGSGKGQYSVDGLKPKDLIGIPWMAAFALRADGWYLRQDIIWSKPNPMPESVTDRCTKQHEYIFLLSKSKRYYYDKDAIAEPAVNKNTGWKWNQRKDKGVVMRHGKEGAAHCRDGGFFTGETRNKRSVWTVPTRPFPGAHFAVYPPQLILPCILAGCPEGGTVLDPFAGSGTTGVVALENNRNFIGCELNPNYRDMALARLKKAQSMASMEWQVLSDGSSNNNNDLPLFMEV